MQEASERRDPFYGIADPSRRKILMLLSEGEHTIADIAKNFSICRTGVRKHLAILEDAALVKVRKKGRDAIYSLNSSPLRAVVDWISYFDSYWSDRLDSLKEYVESNEEE